jgi:two-component system cell cycle sensor histidine kinase PleC
MFEILGLPPQNRLLSVGEVADLIHPDDTNLVELAKRLCRAGGGQMDQEFRMRHTDGAGSGSAPGPRVVSGPDDEPHLSASPST